MIKNKILPLIVIAALIGIYIVIINQFAVEKTDKSNPNDKNTPTAYVPDPETAKKIAEAIWLPLYGDNIQNQKPFTATLQDSIWIVQGTLPKGTEGGTAYIEIQKKDCKVLKVMGRR